MASAIRTRSRRNGASQNIQGDVATDDNSATSINNTHTPQRSNRRKRARDESEDIDELKTDTKRAKLENGTSPARRTTRNRVVASPTKNGAVISNSTEPSTPRKKQQCNDEPPPTTSQSTPKSSTVKKNGTSGKRERAPISFQDKQVIAESANTGKGDDGKRKLRSEQGAHYKSELSAYFIEYDEVIGNVVKESQLLSAETHITLVDEGKYKTIASPSPFKTKARSSPLKSKIAASPRKSIAGNTLLPLSPREYPDFLFTDLYDTKHFDLGFHLHRAPPATDSLPDSLYEPAHRRLARAEKSVRNQDKDRAQHEKDRVIQLLNGLKGHDWLRILGVTGITESKRKDFESARNYFIIGCENILERFRLWKEEEKRRKLEKDKVNNEALEEEEEQEDDDISDGDPPDYSDVDASAARQLHDEAVARMTPATLGLRHSKTPVSPFKSFFDKPRIREASIRKNKRSTRSEIQAFGQPIPEVEERDFTLDEDLIKEGEAIRRERAGRTTRSTRRSGEKLRGDGV